MDILDIAEENVSQPDSEGLLYYASKVVLLSDGLMVIATLSDEIFDEFMRNKGEQTIKAIPDVTGVTLIVGNMMAIPLPGEVFAHTAQTGNVYIDLSGFNDYLMHPWVTGRVEARELWAVKGVADYIAKNNEAN